MPPKHSAEVISIQLTEFSFNPEYNFDALDEVELKVTVMHRLPPKKEQFDVMVKIVYHNKATDQAILSTSCLTNYALVGMPSRVDPDSGKTFTGIPAEVDSLMRIEALAHARALVASQAASTPFGKIYASLSLKAARDLMRDAAEDAVKKHADEVEN